MATKSKGEKKAKVRDLSAKKNPRGGGKVKFNPFSITRKIDKSSPGFFH